MSCLLVAGAKSSSELPLRNCCIVGLGKQGSFQRVSSWQPDLVTEYLLEQRLREAAEEPLEYLLRLTGSLNEVKVPCPWPVFLLTPAVIK